MATLEQPAAPAVPVAASTRASTRRRALPRPNPYLTVVVASLLLAAATLAFPSAPSYDPWAWLIWGRQTLHLDLITFGGPTWKPLPVLFTTLFAPSRDAAPGLWLLVARAGGIVGIAMAAWLAFRLAPSSAGERWDGARARAVRQVPASDRLRAAAPQLLAAAVAVTGLLLLYQYLSSTAIGEAEGLLVALVLLAVMRHLDGAPRSALVLGFAAALIRPETWPFLGIYGVYVWRREPGARRLVMALFGLVGALWFLPEVWGSGSPLRGVEWAQYPRDGSPAFARCPFCAELTGHGWPLLTTAFQVGVVLALGAVAVALVRVRRAAVATVGGGRGARIATAQTAVLMLALIGIGWMLEEAVLTQMGFTGSDRYLIAPEAILIVVGAVGWASALRLLTSHRARLTMPTLAVAGCFALLAVLAPGRGPHLGELARTLRFDADLQHDMRVAVSRAGGSRRLLACGPIETNSSEAPLAAWTLGVPMRSTESARGDVLIQSGDEQDRAPAPLPSAGYRLLAAVRTVRIYAKCASR